jgi:hypothetical protein
MEPCDPSQPPKAIEQGGHEPSSEKEEGEEVESSASDEIVYAMADLLRSQQLLDALKGWITARTNEMPAETALKRQSLWLGVGFSFLIFVGVAILGHFKVISGDSTTALIGGLIGYWFGQRQRIC